VHAYRQSCKDRLFEAQSASERRGCVGEGMYIISSDVDLCGVSVLRDRGAENVALIRGHPMLLLGSSSIAYRSLPMRPYTSPSAMRLDLSLGLGSATGFARY